MAEDDQEKKHAPTERRLRQAAEKGDVARSMDLPKAAAVVAAVTIGLNAAAVIAARLDVIFAASMADAGSQRLSLAADWTNSFIAEVGPLLVLITLLSTAAGVLFGGWSFSTSSLKLDFSKFSPSHGLGSVFSASGMSETLKSIAKFVIIAGVGGLTIYDDRADFVDLAAPVLSGSTAMVALCLHILVGICIAVTGVAAADMALQFWLHRRKHRMSDQDMRDEMKDSVGNPQIKQRQRAIARRMARARQMKRIPEASVIIINPTHFAVAIRFRRGIDSAPILLAKGADLVALEIMQRARSYGIPLVEAPPLARAVYRYVEPDEHIPVALYRACAEVLAYVWRLQQWRSARGAAQKPAFPRISTFEIGPKFEREADH